MNVWVAAVAALFLAVAVLIYVRTSKKKHGEDGSVPDDRYPLW